MKEILSRYQLPKPNNTGFIPCPFHRGDRSPSMKIYKQDYNCFACGENGDIFSFVQRMEKLSFRDAFLSMGGTYLNQEETPFKMQLRQYRQQKNRETEEYRRERRRQEKNELQHEWKILWLCARLFQPLSDDWCDCINRLQIIEYRLNCLEEKRW